MPVQPVTDGEGQPLKPSLAPTSSMSDTSDSHPRTSSNPDIQIHVNTPTTEKTSTAPPMESQGQVPPPKNEPGGYIPPPQSILTSSPPLKDPGLQVPIPSSPTHHHPPDRAPLPLDYSITRYGLLTFLSFVIFGSLVTMQFATFYLTEVHKDSEKCSMSSMIYMIYVTMIISAVILSAYFLSIIVICYLHSRTRRQDPTESRDEFFKRKQSFYERLPKIRFKSWFYCNLLLALCNSIAWLIAAGINFCVANKNKFVFIAAFFVPSIYYWLCFIVGSLCQKPMVDQDPLCCPCIVKNPRSYDDLARRRNRDADIERYYQRL